MYTQFYHLTKRPFEITSDPSFFFPTEGHTEALAALYSGVRRRKDFVILTGETGTGKTLIVHCLLQILKRSDVAFAYIFNARLNPTEFLRYVAEDFHLTAEKYKNELLLQLRSYALSRSQRNLTSVLIVDEAHDLSQDTLEVIRQLTYVEAPRGNLLQVLLIGQPDLEDKLETYNLRQLKQDAAFRYQLTPLQCDETRGYIHSRLRLAGSANPDLMFPSETTFNVHRHSKGYPRLINTLCENSLLRAFSKQSASVTPEMVDQTAADFHLNVHTPPAQPGDEHIAEVRQAAQALLALHTQLQEAEPVTPRVPAFANS